MRIDGLSLDFFRNYVHLDAAFAPNINVIYGDNAQGKTNLLEAVAYLSGVSHRARYDRELIQFGVDHAFLKGNVFARERDFLLEEELHRGARRVLRSNGVKLKNGCELSGGERQRISIARAFLKDAPIILLDEATASLDVENETAIQEALSRLIRNKTVLIIAHRMRTVSGADKIVVLKDGAVAEQGSPAKLLKEGGVFAHMVQLQTESQSWTLAKA